LRPSKEDLHPDRHRAARDFCALHGIAYFFKQWGEWAPTDLLTAVERGKRSRSIDIAGNVPPGDARTDEGVTQILEAVASGRYTTVAWVGKAHTGALLDGREHKAFPQVRA